MLKLDKHISHSKYIATGGVSLLVVFALVIAFDNSAFAQSPSTLSPILIGDKHQTVGTSEKYVEYGATCIINGNLAAPDITGTFDTQTVGKYSLTYSCTDNGNTESTSRTIFVKDTTHPTFTLNDAKRLYVAVNSPYVDPGATCTDNVTDADDLEQFSFHSINTSS